MSTFLTEFIKQTIATTSSEHLLDMCPALFRREFRTIKMSLPRQSSKTTTLIELYREGDIIIVAKEFIKKTFPPYYNVKTLTEFIQYGRSHNYGYVFVDEPNMCLPYINNLQEYVKADWYIMLGTD